MGGHDSSHQSAGGRGQPITIVIERGWLREFGGRGVPDKLSSAYHF